MILAAAQGGVPNPFDTTAVIDRAHSITAWSTPPPDPTWSSTPPSPSTTLLLSRPYGLWVSDQADRSNPFETSGPSLK